MKPSPDLDLVAEIKARVDIVEVAGELTDLRRRGREMEGLCPLHGENTPSFSVNAEKQVFSCFGCSAGGDVFTLVQKAYGVDFKESLRILAERAGVALDPRDWASRPLPPRPDRPASKTVQGTIPDAWCAVLVEAHGIFQRLFEGSRDAHEYLDRRGVNHYGEVGYIPFWTERDSRSACLSHLPQDITNGLGLTRDGRINPVMGHRIVFPYTWEGRLTQLQGRYLERRRDVELLAEDPGYRLPPKYLFTTSSAPLEDGKLLEWRKGVFHEEALAAPAVTIVEGPIDRNALITLGHRSACAAGGSHSIDEALLSRVRPDATVFLAVDNDASGDKAVERAQGLLGETRIRRLRPPAGFKDWGEVTEARVQERHLRARSAGLPRD